MKQISSSIGLWQSIPWPYPQICFVRKYTSSSCLLVCGKVLWHWLYFFATVGDEEKYWDLGVAVGDIEADELDFRNVLDDVLQLLKIRLGHPGNVGLGEHSQNISSVIMILYHRVVVRCQSLSHVKRNSMPKVMSIFTLMLCGSRSWELSFILNWYEPIMMLQFLCVVF